RDGVVIPAFRFTQTYRLWPFKVGALGHAPGQFREDVGHLDIAENGVAHPDRVKLDVDGFGAVDLSEDEVGLVGSEGQYAVCSFNKRLQLAGLAKLSVDAD